MLRSDAPGSYRAGARLFHHLFPAWEGLHHSVQAGEPGFNKIFGAPVFDSSAPRIRLRGRRIANWWTQLETLWSGILDTLFGFRVGREERMMEATFGDAYRAYAARTRRVIPGVF